MALSMIQAGYTADALDESDIVAIAELPDATAATAAALAVSSPGHLKSYKTTPLLTVQEAMEGMRKAGELTYQAPKGE